MSITTSCNLCGARLNTESVSEAIAWSQAHESVCTALKEPVDSHPAHLELVARLERRCREYEERIADLQEQLEEANARQQR